MKKITITEEMIEQIIRRVIDEKSKSKKEKDTTLCSRGISAAKANYFRQQGKLSGEASQS